MPSVFNLTHFDGCLFIAHSHLPLKIEIIYIYIYIYICVCVYIKIKKKLEGLVITVNVIKASTSKVLLFFISQCLNGTFSFIQQSTVESNRKC